MNVIVHNLLVTRVWKQRVFPLLKPHLSNEHNSLKAYFLNFAEASLVNLLEVVLFEKQAFSQLTEDLVCDLIDYVKDKLSWLCSRSDSKPVSDIDAADWTSNSTDGLEFSIAMNAVAILRCLTDAVDTLSITVLTKLLKTTDMICSLVFLMEEAPWIRIKKKKEDETLFERFEDGKWESVKNGSDDFAVLGKMEAQAWIALYNLLMDIECRKHYTYTKYNQKIVLRVKKTSLT